MEPERETPPALKATKSRRKSSVIWILGIILCVVIGLFALYIKHVNEEFAIVKSIYSDSTATDSGTDGMASMVNYNRWKNATFTIPEYDNIPKNFQRSIVKICMDKGYFNKDDQANYFLTKIADRAKEVYAFGNFTGSSETEMAFILERNDFESSELYIVAANGDLLFWKELPSELPTIKRFKQGAKIYTEGMELRPSKIDGLITNHKGTKYAYLYNQKTKTFDRYYQYTDEEVQEANEEIARERIYELERREEAAQTEGEEIEP